MKRSDINEVINSDSMILSRERYAVHEIYDTTKSFFNANFGNAVNVECSISHPAYLMMDGQKFASLLTEALKTERGDRILHIYFKVSDGEFHVVIGAAGGIAIDEEKEDAITRLAKDAEFRIIISDGTIIISKDVEKTDSVTFNSITTRSTLAEYLAKAFFGEE